MVDYSREFGSQYPSELIPLGTHKDVDDSVVELINEYNSYIENNDMKSAYQFYLYNKDTLDPYIITMNYFNYLEEEVYNTGIFALMTTPTIHSTEEPIASEEGSYWIQEYE